MKLLLLFYYLFIFPVRKYQERLGNDERYPLIDDKKEMPKIIENFKKKELLEYLQSDNVIEINKVNKIIEYYGNTPKPMNLLNGGLLDDWNFEF